jgi:nucleotide-binding universal stress UspA family protein
LLVALDLGRETERVLARAARLPLATGARVTLLHVVPRPFPGGARAAAIHDARTSLRRLARGLLAQIPVRSRVRAVVRAGVPAAEIAEVARAARAELIVVGRGAARALREAFLGSTAERVVRRGDRPVLVVRLPARAPYRRPLLALDRDQAAHEVLALALRLVPAPRPRLGVVHAFEAPFEGLIYPSLTTPSQRAYRAGFAAEARREILDLLEAERKRFVVEEPPDWKLHVRPGSARDVVLDSVQRTRADLLALGTRARAGLAQLFLGTVAGDVLREVGCDVLVVPPRGRG